MDSYYGWPGKVDPLTKKYELYGLSNSYVKWDDDKSQWKLGIYGNNYTYAICNDTDTKSILPFGANEWYIFNDTCLGKPTPLWKRTKLSLSRCMEDQFACDQDGTW